MVFIILTILLIIFFLRKEKNDNEVARGHRMTIWNSDVSFNSGVLDTVLRDSRIRSVNNFLARRHDLDSVPMCLVTSVIQQSNSRFVLYQRA